MAYESDNSVKSLSTSFIPTAFGELGKKQLAAAAEIQKELLDATGEMNRAWLAHTQSQVTLASELVGKLAAARSLPDAVNACQETMNRQREIFADDGGRMLVGAEKLMCAGARLLSPGLVRLSS